MRFVSPVVLLTLMILGGYEQLRSQANNSNSGFDLVDKSGNIRKPADYRDTYQALGTYAVLDAKGGGQMHYTYASLARANTTARLASLPMERYWSRRSSELITLK